MFRTRKRNDTRAPPTSSNTPDAGTAEPLSPQKSFIASSTMGPTNLRLYATHAAFLLLSLMLATTLYALRFDYGQLTLAIANMEKMAEAIDNLTHGIPHDLILDVSLDKPEPIPVECAVCKDELSKLAADYKEYKDKVSTMSGSAESLSEKYQHMEEELKSSNAARTVLQTQVDNLVEEKRVLAKQLGIHIN
mmetsp:Transcript_10517/g.31587  ORF Transcript_10517/g.31587 Transcript_10517/m.31587 type:complete len:192 (-) Transcript_10517:177-752(-)